MTTDEQLQEQIEALEAERERLRAREGADDPTQHEDVARLAEIDRRMGQVWDLLRQRRARRAAGDDPDGALLRAADTVEGYRTVTPYRPGPTP
jgi:hypothetical protein